MASLNSIASSEIINYWHDNGNNRRNVKIKIIAVKIKHDIIQSKAAGQWAPPNENACMLSLAEINC